MSGILRLIGSTTFYALCLLMVLIAPNELRAQPLKENVSDRRVENLLISPQKPERTFQITNTLPFIAKTSFSLKEKTDAEVFFFADVKKGSIKRFLQFQFESFKPNVKGTYKDKTKGSGKDR